MCNINPLWFVNVNLCLNAVTRSVVLLKVLPLPSCRDGNMMPTTCCRFHLYWVMSANIHIHFKPKPVHYYISLPPTFLTGCFLIPHCRYNSRASSNESLCITNGAFHRVFVLDFAAGLWRDTLDLMQMLLRMLRMDQTNRKSGFMLQLTLSRLSMILSNGFSFILHFWSIIVFKDSVHILLAFNKVGQKLSLRLKSPPPLYMLQMSRALAAPESCSYHGSMLFVCRNITLPWTVFRVAVMLMLSCAYNRCH